MESGWAVRCAALRVLQRVRAGAHFDDALAGELPPLTTLDGRLLYHIAAGVLRHRTVLDRQLVPRVQASWHRVRPDVRDLLRIGTYQIQMLDRVPSYAAVQATVEAAKRALGTRAAGMVNAVLRRVASEDPLPGNGGLAARYSHPPWLVRRWEGRFGRTATEALLARNNRPATLHLKPVGWTRTELLSRLEEAGYQTEDAGHTIRVSDAGTIHTLPGFADGAFVVQDEAQARLIEFATIPSGRVWDVAAAPGGKAASLAGRTDLFASDGRRERIPRLRDTLRRLGMTTPIFVADAGAPPVRGAAFDTVIVDAPCSATGTFGRHPDARWRLNMNRIVELARVQATMLDGVAPVVRPGGLLVYLTCSLEPEENVEQIDGFLGRHPEFERDGEDLEIMPFDAGTDGGFGARLRRAR